jgi:predicted permease
LAASRVPPAAGLRSARVLGRPRLRLGRLLVVGQIAMSLTLVAGTGLLVRTLVNLRRIQLGFDAEHLRVFKVNAAQAGHPEPRLPAFYDAMREAVAAISGVRAAAYSDQCQVAAGCWNRLVAVDGKVKRHNVSGCMLVSDSFFETLQISLLAGRGFNRGDGPGASRVAVVNRAFVETFLSGQEPLGRRFKSGAEEFQIVGVCANARYVDARNRLQPVMYLPYRQAPAGKVWFQVRSVLPAEALAPVIRKIVAGADANMPLADFTTQQGLCDRSTAEERLFATLGGALAGLAVALSCLGVYGLMAYDVRRRTGEIGIRMALGARRVDVARPILREAAVLAAAGVALGLPATLAAVRIVRWLLHGVRPFDPLVLTAGAVLMVLMAALAAWVPARRAARVEPMVALRNE